ncbi:aromatic amino acid transaminase [Brevundimonas naejangsanensis]|uniref:aromatic amino acid transaminase n=1 Tax=Brevundimonas naejangsanensis TaxID=588932 RepID=UPI003208070B
MALGLQMQADSRPNQIDLGVGTYRDEAGRIPVMTAVKAAERLLVEQQDSKGYVGPSGDAEFARRLQDALFPDLPASLQPRLSRIQTPGGTGALRLALQLIAQANPDARVWIATPSWPAHLPLIAACGLTARTFRHLDPNGEHDRQALADALAQAQPGDVVLLHGCCHNPTGVDLDVEAWREVVQQAAARGLAPLIDLAYSGLGEGIEADVAGVRALLQGCDNALVALSCSKSFGLYRDRTGALLMLSSTAETTANLGQVAAAQARLLWSNPPDHGAAVVRIILSSDELTVLWRAELGVMRERVNQLRRQLASLVVPQMNLASLTRQRGMFALLPLSEAGVHRLRQDHAVYMDASARINVAGINDDNFQRFFMALSSLEPCLPNGLSL